MLALHLGLHVAIYALPYRANALMQGRFSAQAAIKYVKVRHRRAQSAFKLDPRVATLQQAEFLVGAFRAFGGERHVDRAARFAYPFGQVAYYLDAFVACRNAAFLAFRPNFRRTENQRRTRERDFKFHPSSPVSPHRRGAFHNQERRGGDHEYGAAGSLYKVGSSRLRRFSTAHDRDHSAGSDADPWRRQENLKRLGGRHRTGRRRSSGRGRATRRLAALQSPRS